MATKLIGIDGNEANTNIRVGVGQYAYNIIKQLSLLDKNNCYRIYLKKAPLDDMPPANHRWQYHVFGPEKLWTRIALPFQLFFNNQQLDFFFSPSHYSPLFSPCPTVPTIHDLGYLKALDQFNKRDIYQLVKWTEQSLRKAYHIIAVSNFTKNDIIQKYQIPPHKISVVPNGVTPPIRISSVQKQQIFTKFRIDSPFFVALGTLKPNKNYPFLIKAFAKYLKNSNKHKLKLVIAGKKGWLFDDIFQTVIAEKIQNNIIFTDYISESEKWILLKNCISLLIPSTYEGFGIPAIESQSVGTPVIAAKIPPLLEVLEDSAIFINPLDQNSLITALKQVQDPKTRLTLINKGNQIVKKYTWKNSALKLVKTFNII